MKGVFRLIFPAGPKLTERGANFALFECDYATIGDLVARLNDGWLVSGHWLRTLRHPDVPNTIEIVGRKEYALARAGVAAILEVSETLIEPGRP